MQNATPRKILVFRIGHLGDTLVALPAFWRLRDTFPNAEITLLSNADLKNPHYISAASVLPESGIFDSFMAYPTGISGWRQAFELLKLLRRIRVEKFDHLFYMMTRNRGIGQIHRDKKFFGLAGISNQVGFDYLKNNRLDENAVFNAPPVSSESEFLLDLLSVEGQINIGPKNGSDKTDLLLTDNEINSALSLLEHDLENGLSDNSILVALAPGSKWDSKKWESRKFSQTITELNKHFNIYPVIFGGKEDVEVGDHILKEIGFGSNMAGTLSVRESAALLSTCSIYIGNDTGTMHLAAAVGTPCVAIFSAIDWVGRWNPVGNGHIIIRRRVECEGCHSPICRTDHRCLELITVEEVVGAASQILSEINDNKAVGSL